MEEIVETIPLSALQEGVPETASKKQGFNKKYKVSTIVLIVIIVLIIFVIPCVWPSTQSFCPDGWIGFQKNCYYFSKQEGDWNSSRHECFTEHADLTVIDTEKEMVLENAPPSSLSPRSQLLNIIQFSNYSIIYVYTYKDFLRQQKCIYDLWIGLEMTENQSGKWVNGRIFNKRFYVRGNEKCAYLSDDGVATARCYTERKWICRKTISTT